jgi:Winged helix DNA-binding domain
LQTVSVQQRRRSIVRRHHLDGSGASPEEVTQALLALHATDPASVYLSVLARSTRTTLADVSEAMYERRSLVRWMAMRRTLFLLPRGDVPAVQAAVSAPLAATLRRRLISLLERNGSEPPIEGEVGRWLAELEVRVEAALRARGTATGAQLGADEPALRTVIPVRAPSDVRQTVTSPLLTVMSTEGRLVRSTPTGSWTSRHHRWEPVEHWWPDGLPQLDEAESQQVLARRWLTRFGPATADDLRWWTGWTKTTVQQVLSRLPIEEVDLHGQAGIALGAAAEDAGPDPTTHTREDPPGPPAATLLPALDPTPMGWKHREWFFGIDQHQVFDRNGNIGPTLWWDGEIIGSWAVAATGEIRLKLVADRGTEASNAIGDAAARLHDRLHGAVITPAIRTPLERSLT